MNKLIKIIYVVGLLILLTGCNGKSTAFPDSSKPIIANDNYIAFFDVDNNAIVIDFENGIKTISCEIPIIAMYEADYMIVLKLETGKYILHDPREKYASVDGIWNDDWSDYYIDLYNFISCNDLDKLCIISPSCVYGLSTKGKIVGDHEAFINENLVKIIGTSFAEYSLDNKGHVHVYDDAYQSDSCISEIESWENITDIECGLVPFALTNEGTILTTKSNSYYSSNVMSWENVKTISAKPFSTAALTNDGRVKICSHNDDYYEAENWEDVVYIQMADSYLLGVTSDGGLLLTPFGYSRFNIDDILCPKIKIVK